MSTEEKTEEWCAKRVRFTTDLDQWCSEMAVL